MIYCIGAYEDEAADTPIALKLGYTRGRDAEPRRSALQTGNPHHLEILWTIPWGTRQDERALHQAFAEDRVRGEWFAPERVSLIAALEHLAGDAAWRPLIEGQEYVAIEGELCFIDDAPEGSPEGPAWPTFRLCMNPFEPGFLLPDYEHGFFYLHDVRSLAPIKAQDIPRIFVGCVDPGRAA